METQTKGKRAAIDLDTIANKPLSEISAADFLSALDASGTNLTRFHTVWPEKKKVELWAEPEHYGGIKVGDIIVVVKREKKKVELEKDPGWEYQKLAAAEVFQDPRTLLRDPEVIRAIAQEVAIQLRTGR